MVDLKFFSFEGEYTLEQLAHIGQCDVYETSNPEFIIHSVAPVGNATAQDICFLSNTKYLTALSNSSAGACILAEQHIKHAPKGMQLLVSHNPYTSYAKIANALFKPRPTVIKPSIHSAATIHPSATIGNDCQIAPGAVLEANVTIGDHVIIGANSVIREGCIIGDNTIIDSLVNISFCEMGSHCTIHSGVKIGQDGFGFATDKGKHIKVPQLGRVIIGNEVEIGSNTTIDRGAGPDTQIGDGTKIDNLVQIGHNVSIGKGCFIVSHVGISGSTSIGNYVVLGGQVGVAGHISIGDMVQVAAQSGVTRNLKPQQNYGGSPAIEMSQWRKQIVAIKRLVKG